MLTVSILQNSACFGNTYNTLMNTIVMTTENGLSELEKSYTTNSRSLQRSCLQYTSKGCLTFLLNTYMLFYIGPPDLLFV